MFHTGGAKTEEMECGELVSKSSRKSDSDDDLQLLLECLRFQRHCIPAQKQALTTIAAMCSNSSSSRNLFNANGGLAFVLDLLYSTQSPEIQQASMYTLGCASENNVTNQLKLCNEQLFSFLVGLLMTEPTEAVETRLVTDGVTVAIAFLAGCLMSSNARGQNMSRGSKLLSKLISLFKSHLPSPVTNKPIDESCTADGCQYSLRLWSSVCSALCTATNNPQNETNQWQCTKLIPAALSVLELTPLTPDVLRPAISLLASCVANNRTAQDRLRLVGGLQSLVKTLREIVNQTNSGQQESKGSKTPVNELASHIVKSLSAAAFGHSDNCRVLVDLDCVRLLLYLLHCESLDQTTKLNIVLCLGMLTEDNAASQHQLAETDGMYLLVEVMASSQSEELIKAVTFVLQCCVSQTKHPESRVEDTQFKKEVTIIGQQLQVDVENHDTKLSSETNVVHKNTEEEILELLDGQKVTTNERVSHWLHRSFPGDTTVHLTSERSKDALKNILVNIPVTNNDLRNEFVSAVNKLKKQDDTENVETEIIHEETAFKVDLLHTQTEAALRQEKELRQLLEKQLAQEREKRRQLEKKLAEKMITFTEQDTHPVAGHSQQNNSSKLGSHINLTAHTKDKPITDGYLTAHTKDKPIADSHLTAHTKDKPIADSHLTAHTKDKPIADSHLTAHTKDKPIADGHLNAHTKDKPIAGSHLNAHTKDKPITDSHLTAHTKDKPIANNHLNAHTKDKPIADSYLNAHTKGKPITDGYLTAHTKDKPITGSHLNAHTKDKPIANNHLNAHTKDKPIADSHLTAHTKGKPITDGYLTAHTKDKPITDGYLTAHTKDKPITGSHLNAHTKDKPITDSHLNAHTKDKPIADNHLNAHTKDKLRHIKTPQSSGKSNVRYATSVYTSRGIHRLLQRTNQDQHMQILKGKAPNTCSNTHSLLDHVHMYRNKEAIANHYKQKSVKERVEKDIRPHHETANKRSHKRRHASTIYETESSAMGDTQLANQTHTSCQQTSSNKIPQTPDVDITPCSKPPPIRESGYSFLSQRKEVCNHHCLACKPRIKCPLITSRTFVKLLRTDSFTCAYHRRFASRMMNGGMSNIARSVGSKPSAVYIHPDQTTSDSSERLSTIDPRNSEELNKSPCSSLQCNDVDVETTLSCKSSTDNSESEYFPFSSESNLSSTCRRRTKNSSEEDTTPSLHDGGSKTSCHHDTDKDKVKEPTRLSASLVPTVYKLVPGNHKPPGRIRRPPKSSVLKDITNQPLDSVDTCSSLAENIHSKESLAVYDYSTPDQMTRKTPLIRKTAMSLRSTGELDQAKPISRTADHQQRAVKLTKQKVQWTREEEKYLQKGVALAGPGQWRHILTAFPFHSSRNGVSLKDKYRNMLRMHKV